VIGADPIGFVVRPGLRVSYRVYGVCRWCGMPVFMYGGSAGASGWSDRRVFLGLHCNGRRKP
jgi:hypothetical protein